MDADEQTAQVGADGDLNDAPGGHGCRRRGHGDGRGGCRVATVEAAEATD